MAEDMDKKQKELQKKYLEYQMMEQQIKQLQQQLEKMEAQTMEISTVDQSLEDISKAKAGDEVLVPVSGGIFFRTTIKETGQFLVNVGSGVVVDKNIDGTRQLVQGQAIEIDKYKEQVMQQLALTLAKYQEMENELKKLIEG
ncbi:prefoldin subunit alpha [Nanoarchaeota archaeon]